MKLKIKQSSWSGWVKDYKPVETEEEYDINENEKYIIKTTEISYMKDNHFIKEKKEKFSFEIVEVNDDYVKIHTFQSFSDKDDGTISLLSKKKDFIVNDKPLKLTTTTMDCGEIYTLTLIK